MQNFDWKKLQNGSDIRGVALEGIPGESVNLTPEIAKILGQAFISWLEKKLGKSASKLIISLGRDSRLSGPDLLAAASEGISLLRSTVYNFEIASTPAMFMSTINPDLSCDGAIMLTASHLPFNRNGLKFFTKNGGLNKGDITEILNLAENNNFPVGTEKGNIKDYDFISVYSEGLVKKVREGVNHTENFEQPLKGLKIIVLTFCLIL